MSGPGAEAAAIPAVVLGGSGYVAGELLRLLAGHPAIRPVAAFSESQAGEPVEAVFPHLSGCYRGLAFSGRGEMARIVGEIGDLATQATVAERPTVAAFSAAPHGSAAPLVDELMSAAEAAGVALRVVDLSADFRFPSAGDYARVYGKPHGAPARLSGFRCALPEHRAGDPGPCVGHPGCFTTATLLAAVPLLALSLVEPRLSVVAVTGSTGAGRAPGPTTHHPARRSNLFAYSPLSHRHEPEMRALAEAASGVAAEIHFVPQAGPFARGIYATVQARLARRLDAAGVREALAGFYAGALFVHAAEAPPRLQDVVGSNRCHLAAAVDGDHLAVFSAIDNLVKGAAGGAIQWMNLLLGLPETAGLTPAGLGWL